jgi:putative tricarboxylic transport membrane protein
MLSVVTDPLVIVTIFAATGIGIIFGSIPGLTATMAIVMFLPMTYSMSAVHGMTTLVSLYIGGISGGLIAAILLNIPGTPSSVATCLDGYPMAKKGEAGKALGAGIVFSFIGTIFGFLMLIFLTPILAKVAIRFGAYEYCALALFSLSLVVILTGKDLVKGLISAVLGTILATVGLSPIDSRPRFTFGSVNLTAGFKLLVFLIGLFAIVEVVKFAEEVRDSARFEIRSDVKIRGFGFSMKEFTGQAWNAVRSSIIGIGIGILPGIGGGVSCMISYTAAKKSSKTPEKFGTGILDGVVASETANNATIGGAMIPMLSLGIPGDPATAMLLGGLMVHSVSPGPLIFDKSGPVVYGIFTAVVVSAIAMLILEFIGIKAFVKILKIPKNYMLPVIVVLCCVGAIGDSNRVFDAWGVLLFGLIGYAMYKVKIPQTPMILGFILGPMFELNIRKVSQLATVDPLGFTQHPIAIVFFVVTVVTMTLNIRSNRKAARAAAGGFSLVEDEE